MKIKIEITCDNAAFDDQPGLEVARLLRKLADGIEQYPDADDFLDVSTRLLDINGNHVGNATVSD